MKIIRWLLLLGGILLLVGLPLGRARADLGPKPTVEFYFEQGFEGDPLTIVSGTLLQCDQPDCSDARPLPGNMGPQRFGCEGLTCSGLAYGFTEYGKLDITFSDGKVRQSNIFTISGMTSIYDVTINENDLVVTERIDPSGVYVLVLCLCCCCGVLLAAAVIVGVVVYFVRRQANA
jgi:hypothetical protein